MKEEFVNLFMQKPEINKGNSSDKDLVKGFNKAEEALLLEALARTHTERFYFLTRLIKVQKMMEKAKITHHP